MILARDTPETHLILECLLRTVNLHIHRVRKDDHGYCAVAYVVIGNCEAYVMPVRARIGQQRSCDFVDAELTPAEGRRAGRAREAAWAEERGTDVRGSEPPSHRSSGAVDAELAPAESPQAGTRSGRKATPTSVGQNRPASSLGLRRC
jgi:hypothetical protein